MEDELEINNGRKRKGTLIDFNSLNVPKDDIVIDDEVFTTIDEDNELIDCLLNLPQLDYMENPINMTNIFNH